MSNDYIIYREKVLETLLTMTIEIQAVRKERDEIRTQLTEAEAVIMECRQTKSIHTTDSMARAYLTKYPKEKL